MKIKDGFTLHQIGDEYIIMYNGTQNVNFNNIISLNSTAAHLWKHVEGMDFNADTLTAVSYTHLEVYHMFTWKGYPQDINWDEVEPKTLNAQGDRSRAILHACLLYTSFRIYCLYLSFLLNGEDTAPLCQSCATALAQFCHHLGKIMPCLWHNCAKAMARLTR